MQDAFLYGLLATSSLILGGIIGSAFKLSKKLLGIIMAFGSGVLISAVAYELIFESIKMAVGSGFPAMGLFAGALVFFFSDRLIGNLGAVNRKSIGASHASNLAAPMILGILLDGIPESLVIGLGILETGTVSLAILIAVFISNLPEAIAGTTGMISGKWSKQKIILLWIIIAIVCALFSMAGYSLFENISNTWLSFIQAFAGGAILVMLANTMMPEAYEHGGKLTGIFTVLGFAVSVTIILIEKQEQIQHLMH